PQKAAIVDHDGTRETTWAELLETATKIACYAQREGLSGIVPILQGRTMEYVATILGLNMAGIAVVNLTDTYPEERVNYICEDVGASVHADNVFVERAMGFPAEPFEFCGDLSDIAMLLYTSGSTGTPKGVVYDNHCLLCSIARNIKEVELDEQVIYASTGAFNFAVSQFELLATLASGATVHIISEDCRKDVSQITQYFNKHKISHAFIPFQLFRQIHIPLPFMKLVLLGSERIIDITLQTYKIMIVYASSESTLFVTHLILDRAYENPPIGKPVNGMTVYLLDKDGNLCDEGEICVAGPIAKGYWNRPELTAKTFVPNPFATGEHDKVLLHTGDIAKRLPDGNFLYLNRNDWMVKISGQRVEPGEIEAVMQQLPEVKQAVVKGFIDTHGQAYLCGFYTVTRPTSNETVRMYLAKNLPTYMQPRYLTQLVAFPTNINGKLDRLSLEAPKAAEFQSEYVAPETPEESLICRAFETVLNVKPIGVFDDFFRMGGDSLGIMALMIETEQLHLKPEYVFNGKTPRGIAALIPKDSTTQTDIYADCQEVRAFSPLTSSQKIVMNIYLSAPWSDVFNMPYLCTFPLDADVERIRKALLTVFAHYPVLSVKVVKQDGIYGMVQCPERKLDIPILDIREDELAQKKIEFVIPFRPEDDLLIRSVIYRTEKQIYLFWDTYHMVMDGTSMPLFFKQFVRAYQGEALVPEQFTQFHLSNCEQKFRQSKLFQEAKRFFDQKLTGHIFPSAPAFDHPDANYIGGSHVMLRSLAGQVFADKLERFVNTHGITVATFFTGMFAYTLQEMTQNEDVYFLSVESGRNDPRFQNTLGQVIQHIPLTVSFAKEATVIEHLQKLQADFIESLPYDYFPFELLEREYGVTPYIMYIYQG
ncbi:MAG: non-ribosomal peptide synthetase, partial [Ruthenibacterium sp.]